MSREGPHRAPQSWLQGSCRSACLSDPLTGRDKGPLCGRELGAGRAPGLCQDPGPSRQPCNCGAAQRAVGGEEGQPGGGSVQTGPHRAPLCRSTGSTLGPHPPTRLCWGRATTGATADLRGGHGRQLPPEMPPITTWVPACRSLGPQDASPFGPHGPHILPLCLGHHLLPMPGPHTRAGHRQGKAGWGGGGTVAPTLRRWPRCGTHHLCPFQGPQDVSSQQPVPT